MASDTGVTTLPEYLMTLLSDSEHREAFLADPRGHLTEYGLSDLSPEDVTDTVEAMCHQLPAAEAEKFEGYLATAGEGDGDVVDELTSLTVEHRIHLDFPEGLVQPSLTDRLAEEGIGGPLPDDHEYPGEDDWRPEAPTAEASDDAYGAGAADRLTEEGAAPADPQIPTDPHTEEGVVPGDENTEEHIGGPLPDDYAFPEASEQAEPIDDLQDVPEGDLGFGTGGEERYDPPELDADAGARPDDIGTELPEVSDEGVVSPNFNEDLESPKADVYGEGQLPQENLELSYESGEVGYEPQTEDGGDLETERWSEPDDLDV